jgi:hypothetical protein
MRTVRKDIKSITTYGKRRIILNPGQIFCETPKAYELWAEAVENGPFREQLRRLKRWPKSRIWAVNNEVL